MLQAFIDDSLANDPPIFVQAGCIASTEQWVRFSEAWQAVLDNAPRLDYFKMKEAWALRGQFSGWSQERRNARLADFYKVIESHISGEFLVSFRTDALKRAYALWPRDFGHPYYFAVPLLMAELARNLDKFNLDQQRVDFIYDEQLHEKDKIIAAWEWGTTRADPNPPHLLEILKKPPTFENDKEVLPLQAADLIAWWVRRRFVAQANGETPIVPPFKQTKPIPWFACQMNEEQLRKVRDDSRNTQGSYYCEVWVRRSDGELFPKVLLLARRHVRKWVTPETSGHITSTYARSMPPTCPGRAATWSHSAALLGGVSGGTAWPCLGQTF